jgi:hypothetical protein
MKSNKTNIVIAIFVILEVIIGTIIGKYFLTNYQSSGSESLMYSVFVFYLTLNAIFFVVTIALGTISIWALNKWKLLSASIILSGKIGIVFLIIYTMAFNYLSYSLNIRQIPLFFTLLGFILGFNLGIVQSGKLQKEKVQ